MATYLEQSLIELKRFEGVVPWMYRDTVGKVTVGVGLMLPDAAAACALPFTIAGRPASPTGIAAEYARVSTLPTGHAAAFYKVPGGLELPPAEIDSLLLTVLNAFKNDLVAHLPSFDSLPDPVKIVLLDMAYNLGIKGLLNGYPRLVQAVESGAWLAAADECARHGIGDARNAWAKAHFLAAVVPSIQAAAGSRWRELLYGLIGWAATRLGH